MTAHPAASTLVRIVSLGVLFLAAPHAARAAGENLDLTAQLSWSATSTVTDLTTPGALNKLYVWFPSGVVSFKGCEFDLKWEPTGDPDNGCMAHSYSLMRTSSTCTYLNRGQVVPITLADEAGYYHVYWANTMPNASCTSGAVIEMGFAFDGCADATGTFTLCGLDVIDQRNNLNHVLGSALGVPATVLGGGGFSPDCVPPPGPDDAKWSTAFDAAGFNESVWRLYSTGNVLLACGMFSRAGGAPAAAVAQWTGTSWAALGAGLGRDDGNPDPRALATFQRSLYVAGNFDMAAGIPVNGVARWDGAAWHGVETGSVVITVNALANYRGTLIAGGYFSQIGSTLANGIAAWNGNAWSPLGDGVTSCGGTCNGEVTALLPVNGQLIVGGTFDRAGGLSSPNLARWAGGSWQSMGGTNGPVVSLALYHGSLVVGGVFTEIGGVAARNIARWTGSTWESLGGGLDAGPLALVEYNGDLMATGPITEAGGVPVEGIARWDGVQWSPVGSGLRGSFGKVGGGTLAVLGSDLYAGGGFTYAGEHPSYFVARWSDAASAPPLTVSSVEEVNADPQMTLGLRSANPLRGRGTIVFTLPADASAALEIVDPTGRVVRTLASGAMPQGTHTVEWNGTDDAGRSMHAGVYFVRLSAAEETRQLTLLLLRE